MNDIKKEFEAIVSKTNIHRFAPVINIAMNKSELIVTIDYLLPSEDRPSRRSKQLKFIYSKETLEDFENTSVIKSYNLTDKLIDIIDKFTFNFAASPTSF